MFCKNCGKELDKETSICPHCGGRTGYTPDTPTSYDQNSVGFNFLSLVLPPMGIFLNYLMAKEYPVRCKGIKKFSLIGAIIWGVGIVAAVITAAVM